MDVKDKKTHYYISAPLFGKDIQKKSREGGGIAEGLRQSRNQQDAQFSGSLAGRNYQVIISSSMRNFKIKRKRRSGRKSN
ncbi:hypothetical protein NST33_16160 [Paenibacillus sp. FSL L8-0435]|uniref:hypothetical protein n=1 Tax=Paenibacillus TaxID=44249 RepID=UPI0021B01A0D|nr:hypothetical protein [Paenibacillus xylanexedens]